MNNFPWGFVDLLIYAFDLSDCEAADLSNRAQCLIDINYPRNQMVEKLWVRADVLANNGSKMQPIWNGMKQLQGSFRPAAQI